jgi:hypothetical protein
MSRPAYTDQVYSSPGSFSSAFLAGTTLTLAGLPFTPDDSQFLMTIVTTAGGAVNRYPADSFYHSYNSGTGVLTVTGANFLVSDLSIRVVLLGEARAYQASGNYYRGSEVAPINLQFVEETLASETNVLTVTREFPSADGLTLAGFQHLSLNGTLIIASGANALTIQVYGTNDSNLVAASRIWCPLYGYSHGSNSYTNIISCVNTTVNYMWDFDYLNAKYAKIVVTNAAGANNTLSAFVRRGY